MLNKSTTATVAVVACLLATSAVAQGHDSATQLFADPSPDNAQNRVALLAAVALLPKAPARIAVMDVTQARSGVRERLLTLDAFTVKGNGVIYVVQQSELLARARTGSDLALAILAVVLWHEMAHLSGEDERNARIAEETLWTRFVRDGLTDQVTGLRYLQALKNRPDDQMLMAMLGTDQ